MHRISCFPLRLCVSAGDDSWAWTLGYSFVFGSWVSLRPLRLGERRFLASEENGFAFEELDGGCNENGTGDDVCSEGI